MAWNPLGPRRRFDLDGIKALGTQANFPASGIEQSQGPAYSPDIQRALDVPQDMGINVRGFVNPYSLTFYTYPVQIDLAIRVVPANLKRVYLIIQNQGPGNVFLNFGQDVTPATIVSNSNGMQLIQTQIYEQIGGGRMNPDGSSETNAFVSPDYVSIITDTAGTTVLIGEGVWQPSRAVGMTF